MTPQESDSADAALLERYRRASAAQGLEPTQAVRAAILAEARRVAQERSGQGALKSFDVSQPAANQPRWKVAAFGTFGAAVLAALLIVPRWLSPTAPAPQIAANAPAAATQAPAAELHELATAAAPPAPPPERYAAARSAPAPRAESLTPAKRPAQGEAEQRVAPSSEQHSAPVIAGVVAGNTARQDLAADSSAGASTNSIGAAGARARGPATLPAMPAAAPPNQATLQPTTPLLNAVVAGDSARVALLLDAHASPEERDSLGRTPLMVATTSGQIDIVRLLLDRGADPNAVDQRGITPLQQARRAQFAEIAQLLERAGAR